MIVRYNISCINQELTFTGSSVFLIFSSFSSERCRLLAFGRESHWGQGHSTAVVNVSSTWPEDQVLLQACPNAAGHCSQGPGLRVTQSCYQVPVLPVGKLTFQLIAHLKKLSFGLTGFHGSTR